MRRSTPTIEELLIDDSDFKLEKPYGMSTYVEHSTATSMHTSLPYSRTDSMSILRPLEVCKVL